MTSAPDLCIESAALCLSVDHPNVLISLIARTAQKSEDGKLLHSAKLEHVLEREARGRDRHRRWRVWPGGSLGGQTLRPRHRGSNTKFMRLLDRADRKSQVRQC